MRGKFREPSKFVPANLIDTFTQHDARKIDTLQDYKDHMKYLNDLEMDKKTFDDVFPIRYENGMPVYPEKTEVDAEATTKETSK